MTGPGDRESARGGRRRVPRLLLWNAVLLSAGLLAVAVGGEVWLRFTTPFVGSHFPRRFVPGVGSLGKPRTELRWTNGVDYWQISRTNRWGFVDREPVEPEAAAGCHLTVIGDSFVEAKEVALADRSHVVLEALAAERLPRLGITTSAFGRGGTGQIHQLAFYDEYARRLRPKVVVLYFHFNDFADNSPLLSAAIHGFDPERMPYPGAVRDEAGAVRLRPPHPRFADHRLAEASGLSPSTLRALRQGWEGMRGKSFFLDWLYAEAGARVRARSRRGRSTGAADRIPARLDRGSPVVWRNRWQERPRSVAIDLVEARSAGEPLPAVLREAWDLTAFALDEFAARAERDGASLVILLTHRTRHARAEGVAAAVRSLAEPRGIPVVDFFDSVLRRGLDEERARWRHDDHWNENGHLWAAEALLEHLESHPEVCGAPEADRSGRAAEPS